MQQPVVERARGSYGTAICWQMTPVCTIPQALLVRVLLQNSDVASTLVSLDNCMHRAKSGADTGQSGLILADVCKLGTLWSWETSHPMLGSITDLHV